MTAHNILRLHSFQLEIPGPPLDDMVHRSSDLSARWLTFHIALQIESLQVDVPSFSLLTDLELVVVFLNRISRSLVAVPHGCSKCNMEKKSKRVRIVGKGHSTCFGRVLEEWYRQEIFTDVVLTCDENIEHDSHLSSKGDTCRRIHANKRYRPRGS